MYYLLVYYDIDAELPSDAAFATSPRDAVYWMVQKAIPNVKECPEGYTTEDVLALVEHAKEKQPEKFSELWNKISELEKILCFRRASPFLGPADSEPLIKELEELAGECV